jgi:Flp pilus assembly pilin Flp
MSLLNRLWSDESGFIVSAELVLIATVVLIGLIIGLATLRDDIVNELADVGDAFSELNQSYSFSGITGHSSSVSGTFFSDLADFCESGVNVNGEQKAGQYVGCIGTVAGLPE